MKNDEAMDRLLERASRPARDVHPEGCLDAERLAAWSEGSLIPAERAVAEAHAADCDRCLALLAVMAKTAPAAETVPKSWSSLRWMLPLGAAAAVVLAVVLVQDPREVPPAAPMPSAAPGVAPPPPPPSPSDERDRFAKATPAPPERKTPETPAAASARKQAPKREGEAAAKQPARPENQTLDGVLVPPRPAAAPVAAPEPSRMLEFRQSMAALADIASPDLAVRWRIAGTSVARSTDAGQSWATQTTGSEAPLLAGSAPSASVCWIVGRRGTVLLTTDAATWQRLDFPDSTADLVAVTARDARSATVTTAIGRTYRTDDGGRTWVLQENLAAPFYQ